MTRSKSILSEARQIEVLRALGVQEFQGHYFSRPVLVPQWLRDLGERGEAALNLMR